MSLAYSVVLTVGASKKICENTGITELLLTVILVVLDVKNGAECVLLKSTRIPSLSFKLEDRHHFYYCRPPGYLVFPLLHSFSLKLIYKCYK